MILLAFVIVLGGPNPLATKCKAGDAAACVKLAEVLALLALANVTLPGPLCWLQVVIKEAGGLGRPSSLATPDRVAAAGSVTAWSGPALTTGG